MKKINQKTLRDLHLRNESQRATPLRKPLLGVDYGAKFCGLAFSPDGSCVFALNVVPEKELEQEIKKYIHEKNISKIVIGFPIAPNNQENDVCKTIKQFAKKIQQRFNIPIDFQDEKFSTQEGLKFKTKKEKRADHLAAAKILEYYLER